MRGWLMVLGLLLPLVSAGQAQQPGAQNPGAAPAAPPATLPPGVFPPGGPPHGFLFGSWTGGIYPAVDTEGPACFAQPTAVFTRDVVMRVSSLDVAYRQRLIETAAPAPNGGVEFRLAPASVSVPSVGGRLPPDSGFGCAEPDLLQVERHGPDEISFPNCAEFPSHLRRCTAGR